MPNVEDDDLVGSIAQGIENQKRVSHHGHHAHAFLIGAMTYKRQFADQRGQPLNAIDDGHRSGRGCARGCTRKSRRVREARFTSTELSCAVASEHSCYLILTRQFALSHLSKPAPYRSSFFIIETVDTKMLFLNVGHGPNELVLCLGRPGGHVLQQNFETLSGHGGSIAHWRLFQSSRPRCAPLNRRR